MHSELVEGVLQISGEKKLAEVAKGAKSLRNERNNGKFKRSFEFSTTIEPDGIDASFENGLLKIIVPKSEKVLPRKIEIKAN